MGNNDKKDDLTSPKIRPTKRPKSDEKILPAKKIKKKQEPSGE